MAEQHEQLSLGRYLQYLRVKRGLGLDEVSRRTHISRQNLIYIEEEDYDSLPAPVYVKGFLRTYAQLLRINPERVIQYYTEELIIWKDPDRLHALTGRFGFWPRFISAIFILFAVISLTLYSLSFWDHGPDRPSEFDPDMKNQATLEPNSVDQTGIRGMVDEEKDLLQVGKKTTSAEENNLKLEIITLDFTKLKVIIDGKAPETYHLVPEDQLELDASSHFNLLLDNAQGVKLYFNEELIRLSGRPGQNVTIQLP